MVMRPLGDIERAHYDTRSWVVAELGSRQWAQAGQAMPSADRPDWARARYRWRIDLFARDVMRPLLERAGPVSPPNEIDDFVFGLAPRRAGQRPTVQRILMTGRGIGKTTRLKIRALHAMLYGCVRVGAAIAASEDDAKGWVDTLASWLDPDKLPPLLQLLFPELEVSQVGRSLTVCTRFGTSVLLARPFTGALRGLNVDGRRPDALYLDDVEGEDTSITLKARDKNMLRITKKVLPLGPFEGGVEVWWVQTPVHPDCAAVRAMKGHPEMQGWVCRRMPVVRSWPDIDPEGKAVEGLWAENRRIFGDTLTHATEEEREAAAVAHFETHADEMATGAVTIDPLRMRIDAAYRKRWSVGESAWATEYMVDVRPTGQSVFSTDTWPRYEWRGSGHITTRGREIGLGEMRLAAHYDSSDGGDDGALAIVGEYQGGYYLLSLTRWEGSRLLQQTRELPDALAPYVPYGLRVLQWEPPPGAASLVQDQIESALRAAGLPVSLEAKHSTERKEARIVGTLEPRASLGQIVVPEGWDTAQASLFDDFQPSRRDNRDDLLDAVQRAIERLAEPVPDVDAGAVADALDAGLW